MNFEIGLTDEEEAQIEQICRNYLAGVEWVSLMENLGCQIAIFRDMILDGSPADYAKIAEGPVNTG